MEEGKKIPPGIIDDADMCEESHLSTPHVKGRSFSFFFIDKMVIGSYIYRGEKIVPDINLGSHDDGPWGCNHLAHDGAIIGRKKKLGGLVMSKSLGPALFSMSFETTTVFSLLERE